MWSYFIFIFSISIKKMQWKQMVEASNSRVPSEINAFVPQLDNYTSRGRREEEEEVKKPKRTSDHCILSFHLFRYFFSYVSTQVVVSKDTKSSPNQPSVRNVGKNRRQSLLSAYNYQPTFLSLITGVPSEWQPVITKFSVCSLIQLRLIQRQKGGQRKK